MISGLVALPLCLLPLAPPQVQGPMWTQAQLEEMSEAIRVQVEELRGAKFERPVKVSLTDAAGFRKYALERERTMQSAARLHRDEALAKLLGLIAPDLDLRALELELLEKQVGGFYDPGTDTFFLMDGVPPGVARVVLAHELTHALDDQLFDLDAVIRAAGEESDAELAVRAVVEGSGTDAMNRWTLAHGRELSMDDVKALQDMGADELRAAPQLVWKPLLASYMAGDVFLRSAANAKKPAPAAKPEDVARAFREPPRSTEQILHPEKYWDEEKREHPVRVVCTQAAGESWKTLGEDTLGELALALLATPPKERKGIDMSNPFALLGLKFTNAAAEGWGGDRAVLLGRGDDRCVHLVTVWDTPADADEFAAALAACAPKLWDAQSRQESAGWRAGFAPTGWTVERGPEDAEHATVVVRSWSIADPAADSASAPRLAWRVEPPPASAPGGR